MTLHHFHNSLRISEHKPTPAKETNKQSSSKNITLLPPWKGQGHVLPGSILIIWKRWTRWEICLQKYLNELMKEFSVRVPQPAHFTLEKLLTLSAAPTVKISIFISLPASAVECFDIPLMRGSVCCYSPVPHLLVHMLFWMPVNAY